MRRPRVLVLGGDGFCGWPTALHLLKQGYDITIIDNLSRRAIDKELGVSSLTPIQSIETRLQCVLQLTGSKINFHLLDIANDYDAFLDVLKTYQPTAIVHFAEQRAAPYSMKSSLTKRYTVSNNINTTHNLLAAVVESQLNCHIVHLGTMGVYGYGTAAMKIPEGYLDIEVRLDNGECQTQQILYPAMPGSIYHMTKAQDQLMFAYYNKNYGLRITDLHQGIVWGTQTVETSLDERLINRFDYDGDYGTVLNRFLMQSAMGYDLTVHGSGRQTRAFIHISDTVRCIQLAIGSAPEIFSRVRIMNQMTETHRLCDLALMIKDMTGANINYVSNPRNEASENELFVENANLRKLGLEPRLLQQGLLKEITDIAKRYSHRFDPDCIPCRSYW
ncbi:NAD-dependent epimerase/dehydratase family protein [Shewanella surugensis]|uniref:NAD-dependent epimerase/dehydratase family protein n=1 Tax=Shewanella surugensis TaxID=212020 RepID=A0ABT0L8F2_9GAMM|nr:NAD-dependent epimerase/dehydratase family protein [Shewanella surugensis]MCL1123834.1 NAD-dependent epimerase/dehydratase family protein [Shewanella surugensis]